VSRVRARFLDLIHELRRRRVIRVTVAYAAAGFIVLQLTDLLVEPLRAPEWTMPLVVLLLGLGLPVAVLLSWAFQLTPDGIRRDAQVATPVRLPAAPALAPVGSLEQGPAGGESAPVPAVRGEDPARMRVAVLPFRLLRSEPDLDFLGFALADAVACSLAGIQSLLVRSTLRAARYAQEEVELRLIGDELGVDAVVHGTILRVGGEVRLQAQLVRVPDGTLLWSQSSQHELGDLLALQDELLQRIVRSLAVPLTPTEQVRLRRDVPATARAYELYLRANHAGMQVLQWAESRDLYLECLAEDPSYAPAWARLGRCYRVLGKYSTSAEEMESAYAEAVAAFDRALELDEDLPLLQNLYAQVEVEAGRPVDAVVRLLARISVGGDDAELYAGLVHCCRYCGLLSASLAAHEQARQLDPHALTSVANSWFMAGDYSSALAAHGESDTEYLHCLTLTMLGRADEALAFIRSAGYAPADQAARPFLASLHMLLEGRVRDSVAWLERTPAGIRRDGEALFYMARQLARLDHPREALDALASAIGRGFFPVTPLLEDPWLEPLRSMPGFAELRDRAASRQRAAARAFADAGGHAILGIDAAADAIPFPLPASQHEGIMSQSPRAAPARILIEDSPPRAGS
jgi:eukaryotic-like serine/threonine-protein kinase